MTAYRHLGETALRRETPLNGQTFPLRCTRCVALEAELAEAHRQLAGLATRATSDILGDALNLPSHLRLVLGTLYAASPERYVSAHTLADLSRDGACDKTVDVHIYRLRKALGDRACVETLSRRGFRLAPDTRARCDDILSGTRHEAANRALDAS